jgi:hypothetical protein
MKTTMNRNRNQSRGIHTCPMPPEAPATTIVKIVSITAACSPFHLNDASSSDSFTSAWCGVEGQLRLRAGTAIPALTMVAVIGLCEEIEGKEGKMKLSRPKNVTQKVMPE